MSTTKLGVCFRFQSEKETGDRNYAIGYYLKEKKVTGRGGREGPWRLCGRWEGGGLGTVAAWGTADGSLLSFLAVLS